MLVAERIQADLHAAMRERNITTEEEAEEFIRSVIAAGGRPPRAERTTPLERAQEIMYDAWDARGEERIRLALKALAISLDCADAYIILAEQMAKEEGLATRLLEDGVKAGERALGDEMFEQEAGNFWMILETRPYMRARFALACQLHARGMRQEAIGHFSDLLRLNPNDNQGARYDLATCLLEEGDDDALCDLLRRYERDGSAVWHYSRALLTFRKEGESPVADADMREAVGMNPFVPQYITGQKNLPARIPDNYSRGDRSEAIVYAYDTMNVWKGTAGAVAWMEKIVNVHRNQTGTPKKK